MVCINFALEKQFMKHMDFEDKQVTFKLVNFAQLWNNRSSLSCCILYSPAFTIDKTIMAEYTPLLSFTQTSIILHDCNVYMYVAQKTCYYAAQHSN